MTNDTIRDLLQRGEELFKAAPPSNLRRSKRSCTKTATLRGSCALAVAESGSFGGPYSDKRARAAICLPLWRRTRSAACGVR